MYKQYFSNSIIIYLNMNIVFSTIFIKAEMLRKNEYF